MVDDAFREPLGVIPRRGPFTCGRPEREAAPVARMRS